MTPALVTIARMETRDFSPALEAAALLNTFEKPWCIAGGWAIDMFVGRQTRQHQDLEVAVLRDHLIDIRRHLATWKFKYIINQTACPWDGNQYLMLPIHELHARGPGKQQLEIFLQESDGIDWQYRRDLGVRLNLSKWTVAGPMGVPLLNPLLVLLYKSRHSRPKDELDFRVVMESGKLSQNDLNWLIDALTRSVPGHHWIRQMSHA